MVDEKTPADWAIERAAELTNACSIGSYYDARAIREMDTGKALARYIEQHEEAPVDPIADCLREAFGAAAPEFVSAFKAAMAKRDLSVICTTKSGGAA